MSRQIVRLDLTRYLPKFYPWFRQRFSNFSWNRIWLKEPNCNFTKKYLLSLVVTYAYFAWVSRQITNCLYKSRCEFTKQLIPLFSNLLCFWSLVSRRLLCRRLRQTAISYGLMTKLAPKLPPHIFVHTTLRKHIHTKDYIDKRLSKPKLSAAPGNSCTLYARYVGWRHYTALHMRGGGELRRRRRCLGAVVARRGDI